MCVVELCCLWTKHKVMFAVHTSEMCTLEDPAIFWPQSKPLLPHICTYWTPPSSPLAVKMLRAPVQSGFVVLSTTVSTIKNRELFSATEETKWTAMGRSVLSISNLTNLNSFYMKQQEMSILRPGCGWFPCRSDSIQSISLKEYHWNEDKRIWIR